MTTETPLVSIVCTTYNHENYIRQALDGFLMQQCSFPIEVIVHDDASTDHTADIIKEYADKHPFIKTILQTENQYSKGVDIWEYLFTKEAKGKYITICEGDDYWTEPYKLQKQVDFLEKNPEYGLCYSKAKQYSQQKMKFLRKNIGRNSVTFEKLIYEDTIPTLTVCLSKNLAEKYYKEICPGQKNWLMGDYPMWLWFSIKSKIFFMNEIFAVYRILGNSASHSLNIEKRIHFHFSSLEVRKYFISLFNYTGIDLNNSEVYFNLFKAAYNNDRREYRKYLKLITTKTIKDVIRYCVGNNSLLFFLYHLYCKKQ